MDNLLSTKEWRVSGPNGSVKTVSFNSKDIGSKTNFEINNINFIKVNLVSETTPNS